MQISSDKVVHIHYTLKNDAGDVLDTSEGREPLAYLHGASNIIPGLEKALEGKAAGDSLNVSVEPSEGYGERQEQLIQEVPREAFQGVDDIQPGMQFHAQGPAGPILVTVLEAGEESIKIDGNHPLAGEKLHFDVEIKEVRDATDEEKEHGHAHGAGGAHEEGHGEEE
ncbi:MAG: peptidylprolyl isomerase [Gammaproteobacteria bacterium]|nr:peptidylprolyl isomerase [Gammaproteobacteria bacterium]